MDEVLSEVARRAAQGGADTVHSIRLRPDASGGGTEVSAVVLKCARIRPVDAGAVPRVEAAKSVTSYALPGSDVLGPVRTVEVARPRSTGDLAETAVRKLKGFIDTALKREDDGIRASCPFLPGFSFKLSGTDEAWWLVSSSCRSAMLVRRGDDWRRAKAVRLSDGDVSAFRDLARP